MRVLLNSDNGYSNIKFYDGYNFEQIPSLVCSYNNINILQESSDTKNIMVAKVTEDNNGVLNIKKLVVGSKAIIGRAKYNFRANKVDLENNIYPTIIGFAYMLLNNNIEKANLDITTTLTIDDFKYSENIEKYKNVFCKKWEIEFLYGHLRGKKCKINIERNLTSAQCAVGIWDYILNDNLSLSKNVDKILGIDIGFETTDICIMDRMEFDDERSFTIPTGMSDYNQMVINEINNKYSLRKTLENMENDLKRGYIGKINIKNIQKKYYRKLVTEIKNAISFVAPSTIEFSDIILLGGGGIKTFDIFKSTREFKDIVLVKNPEKSNVRGSRKLSRLIWSDVYA